jgi:carbamate kinase
LVLAHGNGPQIGELLLQSEALQPDDPLDIDVAGAMTQGQIGYLLQQEVAAALAARGITVPVCALVTQVRVDPGDPAFTNPTKPVGRFYSATEAKHLAEVRGWDMREDSGRGHRRVLPSPRPLEIVEWQSIRRLVDAGVLVIACGGGGVPVVQRDGRLHGVPAVIDKDLAAQRLAGLLGAETLVMLTGVERVAVDFGLPSQRSLSTVSVDEMEAYAAGGQFPDGSMGPKVAAACAFIHAGGRRAVITALHLIEEALHGDAGTQIVAVRPAASPRLAVPVR